MTPSRLRTLKIVTLAIAGILLTSAAANAATMAVTVAAGNKTTNASDWAAGWEFTVTEDIQVTHLGKFDYENDGILGTGVALYNRTAGGTKLAEASLAGASSEWSGAYTAYYTTITPVTLTTGSTYTIVAVQDAPGERIFWAANTATYADEITYVRGIASSGASLPATFTSNSPQLTGTTHGYFGGTFKYQRPRAGVAGAAGPGRPGAAAPSQVTPAALCGRLRLPNVFTRFRPRRAENRGRPGLGRVDPAGEP
jgi:hypothetical protein